MTSIASVPLALPAQPAPAEPAAAPAADAVQRRFRASLHAGSVHPLYAALRRCATDAAPGG